MEVEPSWRSAPGRPAEGPAEPGHASRRGDGEADPVRAIRVVRWALCATLAWALAAGCGGKSHVFHDHYRDGDFVRAQQVFQSDSSLHDDARAVYEAGLMYADPSSPVFDVTRARRHFERLETLDAGRPWAQAGRIFLQLGQRVDSLETRVDTLASERDDLQVRIEVLRDSFEDLFSDQAVRIDSLLSVEDSLRVRLRRTSEELASVTQQLEQLRNVDLGEAEPD